MSWLFKKNKVLDLRKKNEQKEIKTSLRQSEYIDTKKEEPEQNTGFFNMFNSNNSNHGKIEGSENDYLSFDSKNSEDEKKLQEVQKALQRISRRLSDVTDRLELLERKISKLERN